jgi:hypothetical protein
MKKSIKILFLMVSILVTSAVQAAFVSVISGDAILRTGFPADYINEVSASVSIYNEQQNLSATAINADLVTNGGILDIISVPSTGSLVPTGYSDIDSHLLQYLPSIDPGGMTYTSTVVIEFNNPVIGIFTAGANLFASDFLTGASVSLSTLPTDDRGLDGLPDIVLVGGNIIQVTFNTTENASYEIDQIRVLTGAAVVPVPAAAWLFGSGLLGLIGVARKKESK